jgi:hypothetical protein
MLVRKTPMVAVGCWGADQQHRSMFDYEFNGVENTDLLVA